MTVYNFPDPDFNPPPDDETWRCVSEMGIKETRLLYSVTTYFLDNWPKEGRPPLEQQYLNHLKVKLFAMIADYTYTHQTSPDK